MGFILYCSSLTLAHPAAHAYPTAHSHAHPAAHSKKMGEKAKRTGSACLSPLDRKFHLSRFERKRGKCTLCKNMNENLHSCCFMNYRGGNMAVAHSTKSCMLFYKTKCE